MTPLLIDAFAGGAMPPALLALLKSKGIDVIDLEFVSLATAAGASDTDFLDNVSPASPVKSESEFQCGGVSDTESQLSQ